MEKSRSWRDLATGLAFWWLSLAALWWLLAGGAEGWLVGAVLALAGALLAVRLGAPMARLRYRVLPRFILFFLHALLVGALDVSRRALLPGRRVAPGWVVYPMSGGSPQTRLVLSLMVGLLPGTLASHIDEDALHLHVLDTAHDWQPTVTRLEHYLVQVGGGGA